MVWINYNESNPSVGLCDYLKNINGNYHDYVNYEYSYGLNYPEQLFYYEDGYSYGSGNTNGIYYVGIYLKKQSFIINSFFIKSSLNPTNSSYHPINWSIQGSYDGKSWEVLDYHNDQILNSLGAEFKSNTREYIARHLRFVTNKPFGLRYLEFFGYLTNTIMKEQTIDMASCFCLPRLFLFVFIIL